MIVIAGAVAGVAAANAGVVVVSQMTAPTPHVEGFRPSDAADTTGTAVHRNFGNVGH